MQRINDVETVALTEQCSAILQNRFIPKLKDPGSFSIPCNIGPVFIDKGLCDLGASVSVLPLSICKKLDMELKCTSMTLQLADRSVKYPMGILEDVPVRVGKFFIPVDFVVLDIEEDAKIPIILGRDFLATAGAVIDVKNGSITLNIGDEKITFNLDLALKGPMLENSLCRIDVMESIVNEVMWEVYKEEKSKGSPYELNEDNLEETYNQEGTKLYVMQEENTPNAAATKATKFFFDMEASRISNTSPIRASEFDINLIKVKSCNNGHGRRMLEVRVSESSLNPGRLYYKCKTCNYFTWLNKDDVMRQDEEDEVQQHYISGLERDMHFLKLQMKDLHNLVYKFVKIGIVAALVMVILALKI